MLFFKYDNWTLIEFETRAREIEFERNESECASGFLDQVLTPVLPAHLMLYDRSKFVRAMEYLTNAQCENELITWATITAYLNLHCKYE